MAQAQKGDFISNLGRIYGIYTAKRTTPTGAFGTVTRVEFPGAVDVTSDAQPWISPNGLDLYFGRPNNGLRIFHATRTSATVNSAPR